MKMGIFAIVLAVVFFGMYAVNAYKLFKCDFVSPYKCEAVHVIGLAGPLAMVAVWFDTDTE